MFMATTMTMDQPHEACSSFLCDAEERAHQFCLPSGRVLVLLLRVAASQFAEFVWVDIQTLEGPSMMRPMVIHLASCTYLLLPPDKALESSRKKSKGTLLWIDGVLRTFITLVAS
jgi:hypothetical protein